MSETIPKTEAEFAVYLATKLQATLESDLKDPPFLSGSAVWFTFNNGAIFRAVVDKLSDESNHPNN